jgi:O-antigen ligase
MIYLYYASSALVVLVFFLLLLRNLRQAILAGLIFSTLTLGALPWRLMPVDGVALAVQTMFLVLAFSWLFMRKDTALALSYMANPYTLLLFVLGIVLVAFLLLSDNLSYGLTTTLWFMVKSFLPVVALGCLAPFDKADTRLIVVTIVCGALLMAFALLAWSGVQETERFGLGDDSNPITIARVIGLGATQLLLLAFLKPGIKPTEFSLFSLTGLFMLFALGLTGSRGPLVAALLSVLIGFLLLGAGLGKRLKTLLILGLAVVLLIAIVTLLPAEIPSYPGIERIIDRFNTFGQNPSDRTRLEFFQTAWDGFVTSSGLGVGTGDYATLQGIEGAAYPHNIVLEIAVGQGIVGLVTLFAVLLVTGKQILRLARNPKLDVSGKILIALWIYALFNALVSMDIAGNYFLWVTGGMFWFFERWTGVSQSQLRVAETVS